MELVLQNSYTAHEPVKYYKLTTYEGDKIGIYVVIVIALTESTANWYC